jgi:hypothetical protein
MSRKSPDELPESRGRARRRAQRRLEELREVARDPPDDPVRWPRPGPASACAPLGRPDRSRRTIESRLPVPDRSGRVLRRVGRSRTSPSMRTQTLSNWSLRKTTASSTLEVRDDGVGGAMPGAAGHRRARGPRPRRSAARSPSPARPAVGRRCRCVCRSRRSAADLLPSRETRSPARTRRGRVGASGKPEASEDALRASRRCLRQSRGGGRCLFERPLRHQREYFALA